MERRKTVPEIARRVLGAITNLAGALFGDSAMAPETRAVLKRDFPDDQTSQIDPADRGETRGKADKLVDLS